MQDYCVNAYSMLGNRLMSNQIIGPYPVSFAIHTSCVSELSLQSADLLLEVVSFVFPFDGLFLQNANGNNSPRGTKYISSLRQGDGATASTTAPHLDELPVVFQLLLKRLHLLAEVFGVALMLLFRFQALCLLLLQLPLQGLESLGQ